MGEEAWTLHGGSWKMMEMMILNQTQSMVFLDGAYAKIAFRCPPQKITNAAKDENVSHLMSYSASYA